MKKILSLVILLAFWPGLSYYIRSQNDPIRTGGILTMQEIKPVKAVVHPAASKALARGEKPGQFNNVSYRYANNVKTLSDTQKSQLTMRQDGVLDLSGKIFVPHPDTVYVDPESDLVFRAEPIDEKQMLILKPSLSAVFESVEIPEQEVKVNLANTVSLAENIVASAVQANNTYAVNLQFDSVTFQLDKADEGELFATLVGQIIITNPRVTGKYSKNGGYKLVFNASEQVDLKVYTTVKAKKEILTPIWGTVIKAGDLGKCELGLFMLINMDGEVTLSFEIHQGIEMEMGARGGTFYYVPTSIKNISSVDHWCNINYGVQARMKAFGGLQCVANLKIKSYNALYVYVTGGMEGTVETDGATLDADVGVRIKAGGKIVSKSFTLTDTYYSLWKLQKPDYKGYKMLVHEACAYGDYVVGEIHSVTQSKTSPGKEETTPYTGILTVMVKHPDLKISQYNSRTDEKGIFIATGVPLKKGDMVMIKLPGVDSPGSAVAATIPFKEISLYSADYYAGVAEGFVAGSKSEWGRLVNQQAKGGVSDAVKEALKTSTVSVSKGIMSSSEMVKRLEGFKNNLVVYRGPIEFITQSLVKGQAVLRSTNPGKKIPDKAKYNRGNVNSALGSFSITGLNFEPGQKIKAQTEVEGFTIESEWIETEGLLVSAIEHDQMSFSTGMKNERLSAKTSFVVISPLRGEVVPSGSVKLIKGADVPHGSLTGGKSIPEFPEAKKAIIYFNKTVDLKPLDGNPGSAIGETGPWDVTSEYSSPGDIINPAKNRKHPFEMVVYNYKNHDLGYNIFINECISCTTPVNIINKIGSQHKNDLPHLQQKKAPAPVIQPPVIKNKTIRGF